MVANRYVPHSETLIYGSLETRKVERGRWAGSKWRLLEMDAAGKEGGDAMGYEWPGPGVRRQCVERWMNKGSEDISMRNSEESGAWRLVPALLWAMLFCAVGWFWWLRLRLKLWKAHIDMAHSGTYEEWCHHAHVVDRLEGNNRWKLEESSEADDVDYELLRKRLRELRKLYLAGDTQGLLFLLRSGMNRQFAGLSSPRLYSVSLLGTRRTVEDYINVVAFLLEQISRHQKHSSEHNTLTFFNETRHAHGRTALVLSGGAAMGVHHLGVVKALLQQQLLPMVISGTSAGSIVAALVCSLPTVQLREFFESDTLRHPHTGEPLAFNFFSESGIQAVLRNLWTTGNLHDVEYLADQLRSLFGDITFEQSFKLSGRILNVTVTPLQDPESPLLLNYLTAPHVLVWSAVTASCALPGVFAPVEVLCLDARGKHTAYHPRGSQWADGSIRSDVPLARLGELFNVNHFIVSQVNAHFVLLRRNRLFQTRIAALIKAEVRLRYWQLLHLGLVPGVVRALFPIFLQPYQGDVTITPEIGLGDLLRLFVNPTPEYTQESCAAGERRTFRHLEQIRNHCLIEGELERGARRVARSDSRRPPNGGSTSVKAPSWLWRDAASAKSGQTTPAISPSTSWETHIGPLSQAAADDDAWSSSDEERIC